MIVMNRPNHPCLLPAYGRKYLVCLRYPMSLSEAAGCQTAKHRQVWERMANCRRKVDAHLQADC